VANAQPFFVPTTNRWRPEYPDLQLHPRPIIDIDRELFEKAFSIAERSKDSFAELVVFLWSDEDSLECYLL
jgi:hypothetical protein